LRASRREHDGFDKCFPSDSEDIDNVVAEAITKRSLSTRDKKVSSNCSCTYTCLHEVSFVRKGKYAKKYCARGSARNTKLDEDGGVLEIV